MNAEFLNRITRLQQLMKKEHLDAVFLFSPVNRYYFTGLETSNGLLLVTRDDSPAFYTDFRYLEVAHRMLKEITVEKFLPQEEQFALYAGKAMKWKRIGYEGSLTVAQFLPLREALSTCEWVNAGSLLSRLRAVKSATEINAIRRSAQANDELCQALLREIRPGMTELDMVKIFRVKLVERGLTESFEPIFCAGVNAVECHHKPDASRLEAGSELLIDMGVKVDRYCSDMTRTPFFGPPTPRFQEIHSIVLEANQAAIAAIKPGIPCETIDAVARGIIEDAGYGEYFDHSLGHSVGLDIHEWPNFSKKSATLLEPGMVITVEPGIYISGDVGVRIEDLICVTETGCEVLSHTPHEIIL